MHRYRNIIELVDKYISLGIRESAQGSGVFFFFFSCLVLDVQSCPKRGYGIPDRVGKTVAALVGITAFDVGIQ